jgi:hypothetical protein
MAINNNSFSTNTNIEFGSNDLGDFWLNAVQCNIPGISFSPPEIDGRGGRMFTLPADNVQFSDLIITVLLDKDWEVYDIIFDTFVEMLNIEEGTFKQKKFDMWLQLKDSKGNLVKKFDFYGTRLIDVGEFDMDSRDSEDSNIEIILTFRFDNMDFNHNNRLASLGILD